MNEEARAVLIWMKWGQWKHHQIGNIKKEFVMLTGVMKDVLNALLIERRGTPLDSVHLRVPDVLKKF